MHDCPGGGTPVLVVYERRGGQVERFYCCSRCDCCELWPNWKKGLKYRIKEK